MRPDSIHPRRRGQTLIELLIVVTIMLIVLSMLGVMVGKLVHAVLNLGK